MNNLRLQFFKAVMLIISFILSFQLTVVADEGLWLLTMLKKMNYNKMRKMGLNLTPEEIYSLNQSCIKDAVSGLGTEGREFSFTCTAEMVSPKGLMLTNYHCGYSEIQDHSNVTANYVKNGFLAETLQEELPNEGKTASFLVRMEEVTDKVLEEISVDMNEEERAKKIEEAAKKIEEDAVKDTHYKASVKSFYEGNKYYLMVYETFQDVRLVYAPPSSIGKFGGDTDNWMWPRHTGDFCFFRVYMGPDSLPAPYSTKNIPYQPKHFFPVSIGGVEMNDFAMIMGFPGSTERYMTSYGVEETMEGTNKIRIKVRDKKLKILRKDMDASEEIFIKYTSKYNQSSNYWKYSIGQNQGLKRLQVIDKKKALEQKLMKWIDADSARKAQYGNSLDMIKEAWNTNEEANRSLQYMNEAIFEGAEIIMFASNAYTYFNKKKLSVNEEELGEARKALREEAQEHFKDYNAPTDQALMAELFQIFYENVPQKYHPDIFEDIMEKYEGDFDMFANKLFAQSIFASQERFTEFLDRPNIQKQLWESNKIMPFTNEAYYLYNILKYMPNETQILERLEQNMNKAAENHFENYEPETDKQKLIDALRDFRNNTPQKYHPDIYITIETDYNGDIEKFVNEMFAESIFASRNTYESFMAEPNHEAFFMETQILKLAYLTNQLYEALQDKETSDEKIEEIKAELRNISETYFSKQLSMDAVVSEFEEQLRKYYKDVPLHQIPEAIRPVYEDYDGDFAKFAERVYKKSIFGEQKKFESFLKRPKAKKLERDIAFQILLSLVENFKSTRLENDKAFVTMLTIYPMLQVQIIEEDPAFKAMLSVLYKYFEIQGEISDMETQLEKGQRLFLDARMKMQDDKLFYPDANSTMRLTYGKVGDYRPRDAVRYKYYTTLEGVIQKEDTTSHEFIVPDKLIELYNKKEYGKYGTNDQLNVCFTTDNDITGGNSGSPVLNGNGELIGLAFDGNWEAMSGDIAFEHQLQKTICVDIRYVLFILDKFSGADNLIKEMSIVD